MVDNNLLDIFSREMPQGGHDKGPGCTTIVVIMLVLAAILIVIAIVN